MRTLIQLAALFTFVSSAAFATGTGGNRYAGTEYLEGGVFTYAVFEAAVPHADLENCPAQFDPDAVFCRITLAAGMANIFVFAHDGDQPLLAVKSYELDDGFLPF